MPLSIKRIARLITGDSERHQVAKHSMLLQMTAIVVLAVSFAQSVVVTRYLGVYDFGLISLVTAFVGIVNQVVDFRAWELISNYAAAYVAKKEVANARAILQLAFLISFASGTVAALICVLLASGMTVYVWRQPQLIMFLIVFALSASWAAQTQNMSALLRVAVQYKTLAFIRVFLALLGLLTVSFVVDRNLGIAGIFVAYSGVALFAAVLGLAVCLVGSRRVLGQSFWAADLKVLKERSRELLRYISSTWLSGSLLVVAGQADEFILGIVGSPAVVGIYRVTKNFARLALSLSDPIYEVIYPQFSRLWATQSRRAIRDMVYAILGIGMAFTIVAVLLSVGVGSQVIVLIYGDQYAPGRLLVGLIMLNALYIPFLWCSSLFRVSGHINIALRIEIVIAVVSLTLMVWLTPQWGAYGAALGFVMHNVLYSLIAAIYFWQERRFYFNIERLV